MSKGFRLQTLGATLVVVSFTMAFISASFDSGLPKTSIISRNAPITLWARNPQFLKEIVYRMRFDEASARYGEFGEFYTSYVMAPSGMLDHCLGAS